LPSAKAPGALNSGSSHYILKTPWPRDPRINIQNDKGRAKPHQVRQVLVACIAKLRSFLDEQAAKARTAKKEPVKTAKPQKK
jgi:hypothetical protein